MHIPPYHKKKSWQIFFLGVFLGAIIAYLLLAWMYGKMYEKVLSEKIALQADFRELKQQNEALLIDKEQLQAEASLTVKTIDIHFLNGKQFRFDRLIIHQLSDRIKEQLKDTIGKDIKTVADSSDLLISFIENKTYTIDDLSYQFIVKKITITEEIKMDLEVKFAP